MRIRAIAASLYVVILFAGLVSAVSCGYRFSGSSGPPRGIEKIYIELLENRSTETDVDILITNELKNEFMHKYQGKLVEKNIADAVMSGAIMSVSTYTVSRRGALTSLERRVSISIDLTMQRSDDQGTWYAKGVSSDETYAVVSGDKEATNQNKREAIEVLSRRIAEAAFNRLSNDF